MAGERGPVWAAAYGGNRNDLNRRRCMRTLTSVQACLLLLVVAQRSQTSPHMQTAGAARGPSPPAGAAGVGAGLGVHAPRGGGRHHPLPPGLPGVRLTRLNRRLCLCESRAHIDLLAGCVRGRAVVGGSARACSGANTQHLTCWAGPPHLLQGHTPAFLMVPADGPLFPGHAPAAAALSAAAAWGAAQAQQHRGTGRRWQGITF